MATNVEILDAYSRIDELAATKRELERTIKNAKAKLEKVQADLDLAENVDDIVDGIAVQVLSDMEDRIEMKTLARGAQIVPREAYCYQSAHGDGWAVRVNAGSADRRLFTGGKVLGLGRGWSRVDALEIAKRWLKGDDSAVVA